MKKAFIIIATATLLMTLLVPNIALANIITCSISVKPGCAGEKTTFTINVTGWEDFSASVEICFMLRNKDTMTDVFTDCACYDNYSHSINLPAGNYVIYMNSNGYPEPGCEGVVELVCESEREFSVTECPEPEPEPCYCSLLVQKRDEAGHPINGAKFKVDGIEKKTVNGDARWDDLECGLAYEVRELSPNKYTERIRLEDECGKRSTLRIVNKEEVEVVEEVIIPEAGQDLNFTALYAIAGLGLLRILLSFKRKRE